MQKLDRTGTVSRYIFCSTPIVGMLMLMHYTMKPQGPACLLCTSIVSTAAGPAPFNIPAIAPIVPSLGIPGMVGIANPVLGSVAPVPAVIEPIGAPTDCLLLKNMFDPAVEVCSVSGYLIGGVDFHLIGFYDCFVELDFKIMCFVSDRRSQILILILRMKCNLNVRNMGL
jgi:hypothetical protein